MDSEVWGVDFSLVGYTSPGLVSRVGGLGFVWWGILYLYLWVVGAHRASDIMPKGLLAI